MKLGMVVNNRDVLERLYQTRIDGKRALKLRKAIKQLNEELSNFDEARDAKIKEVGTADEEGNLQVELGSDAYQDVVQYLNEMAASEIDPPEAILIDNDLETLDLSVEDIDKIEQLGLLNQEG